MFRSLKIKITKKWRKLQRLSDIDDNSPTHKTAASIFRLALREPEVELLLRPVEGRRIIKLEDRHMYIILNKTTLEISNSAFSFHLEIPHERHTKLARLFDIRLDALIEKEEQNITSQVHTGLSKVLDTFKKD